MFLLKLVSNTTMWSSCSFKLGVYHDSVVIMFLLHLGFMQSYFGGVCCVCWSPDGRYIAAGGEDDLVCIYGMAERGVVAWGEGHSTWVMQVAFDPW
jgi:WD40 repeat protein